MLLRICLIVAILAGIGVIVVSQVKLREHVQVIIEQRETNARDRDDWHRKFDRSQEALAATNQVLSQTQATLAETRQTLNTTKANLESTQNAKDQLAAELDKVKKAKEDGDAQLIKWNSLGMTPEKVRETRDNLKKAQDTIVVYEGENKILSRTVTKLKNDLERILGGGPTAPPMPGVKGAIMVVDPKWNFVVVNVGEKDGALVDGELMVHRDSKLVGKVKISSVLPDRCVANIMAGWQLAEIHEGDQVLW